MTDMSHIEGQSSSNDNNNKDKDDMSPKANNKQDGCPAEVYEKDSDDSEELGEEEGGLSGNGDSRRAKRLYMNRESARARRKRKKVLLEVLEQQVADLSKRNQVYRLVNESLTNQVQQLESDLSVANATIVMLRSGNGGGSTGVQGAHMYSGNSGFSNNTDDGIHRLLASQSRGLFNNALSAAASDRGLGQQDMLQQRHREMQSQLSQVNIDNVLASLLQQERQQQNSPFAMAPRHDHQPPVNQLPRQDSIASAVEIGRLRDNHRFNHVGGDITDSSAHDDTRAKAFEAIMKYRQQQEQQQQQQGKRDSEK